MSRRKVQRANVVVEKGTPELVAAVDAGEVTVNAAEKLAREPEDGQRRVVAEGPKAGRNRFGRFAYSNPGISQKSEAYRPISITTKGD